MGQELPYAPLTESMQYVGMQSSGSAPYAPPMYTISHAGASHAPPIQSELIHSVLTAILHSAQLLLMFIS